LRLRYRWEPRRARGRLLEKSARVFMSLKECPDPEVESGVTGANFVEIARALHHRQLQGRVKHFYFTFTRTIHLTAAFSLQSNAKCEAKRDRKLRPCLAGSNGQWRLFCSPHDIEYLPFFAGPLLPCLFPIINRPPVFSSATLAALRLVEA